MNLKAILLVSLFYSNISCYSFERYIYNRSKDFADIPVIGVEEKVYGFSAWVWCFGGGVQYARDGNGVGFRSGVIGSYKTGGRGSSIYVSTYENSNLMLNQGNSFIVLNSNSHLPKQDDKRSSKKAFAKFNTNVIFPLGATKSSSGEIVGKWCDSPISVEMSFGVYYGIRFGVNFSEFIDFVFGTVQVDVLDDDV